MSLSKVGLKKMPKNGNGAAGANDASSSASRCAGTWVPGKDELRGAQVGATSTGRASDNVLHIFLFEHCQKMERYGARPLGGPCFWECKRPFKKVKKRVLTLLGSARV